MIDFTGMGLGGLFLERHLRHPAARQLGSAAGRHGGQGEWALARPAFLGDAGQYPGFHDHLVARLARHPQEKPKIFKAVGTKSPWLAQTSWPLVSAACLDACGRRWSLSVGWLAAPLLRSLILIGLGKIASLCLVFLLASQIF